MIDGVQIHPLKQFPDERGKVMHMLRCDDLYFEKFGEIYFSTVHPGVVKGWHMHKEMTLNYACVVGMIKLVLWDGRKDSPTYDELQEFFIGESNYALVSIPPGVWNGFKGISKAVVANCATLPYDPDEIVRMVPHGGHILYDWGVRDR